MADILSVNALEQLAPFLNKDGVLEIALRGKQKRFEAFHKIALGNVPKGEGRELMHQAINIMNTRNGLSEKSIVLMGNVAKLQQLSLLLSGVNLCATCVGFAVMYAKLDKISGQINKLLCVIKQGNEIHADYEFKKVIAEHSDMLDCRKKQKCYSEEQMRMLVDKEYNVLNLLLEVFLKDLATDQENLIFSIYSLVSMFAVSLKYFDDIYYFNNVNAIGDGDVWHSSHSNWMTVFDKLSSTEVVKKIQDHGMMDLNLSTIENDAYYLSLCNLVKELREEVEDNQSLIKIFNSDELLSIFTRYIKREVAEDIKAAFEDTVGSLENEEVYRTYQDAMKQIALVE